MTNPDPIQQAISYLKGFATDDAVAFAEVIEQLREAAETWEANYNVERAKNVAYEYAIKHQPTIQICNHGCEKLGMVCPFNRDESEDKVKTEGANESIHYRVKANDGESVADKKDQSNRGQSENREGEA